LTVSPFISWPSAVTLPYTYKTVPSTLPSSVTVDSNSTEKPQYVVSSSGHGARPEDVIASCKALQAHILKAEEDAQRKIKEWDEGIKERELAEKRRVAPGWLDRDEKILEPVRAGHQTTQPDLLDAQTSDGQGSVMAPTISPNREGEELDRAFGGLKMK
jgi:hypothetical protein